MTSNLAAFLLEKALVDHEEKLLKQQSLSDEKQGQQQSGCLHSPQSTAIGLNKTKSPMTKRLTTYLAAGIYDIFIRQGQMEK